MRLFDDLLRDLQYGLRMLRNAPLVSIAVAITLAIGIGLDAGAFAIINGLLLRPRVEQDTASFARLFGEYTLRNRPKEWFGQISLASYRAIASESRTLAQLAAWRTDGVLLNDEASRSLDLEVSCNFFSVYRLQSAKFGRLFRADDCADSADPHIAILSEELLQRSFGGDPGIVGKTILLNRVPFTVVGVTPLDFSGRLRGPGIWIPYTAQPLVATSGSIFRMEDAPSLWLEGRLRPNVTRAQLASELSTIAPRLRLPDRDLHLNIRVTSGAMIEDPNIRPVAFWLMLLVGAGLTLLLLVSCANVAVLLLSRAAARRREIAIRISLGASRHRLVRQLIVENLMLALAAGAAGLYLALQVPRIFQAMLPTMIPHYPFTLDWHIAAYLAGITLLASILAGLSPAIETLRQDVWMSLKGVVTWRTGHVRWSMRDVLVILQVCFSIVLMVASALFIRAEFAILNADPGLETQQVLQIPVQLSPDRFGPAEAQQYYRDLQQRISAIPSVQSIASSSSSPLGPDPEQVATPAEFRLPSQAQNESRAATMRMVSANYFSALDIPILLGHAFSARAGDASGAVVSQSFASAFWPHQDPIGKSVIAPDGDVLRVIAVARNTRSEHEGEPDGPMLYRLRNQPARGDVLLVRFRGPAEPLQQAVKQIVRELDPQGFVLAATLRGMLQDEANAFWIIGKMLLAVALVAAGLALLGIYGVVGYSVTTRTRELGIRAALGASRHNIMKIVLVSGARPVMAGIIVGLALAVAFALAIGASLREAPVKIVTADPLPYAAVCACLLISSMAAMFSHARRAARIEPLVALREQ